VIKHVLYFVVMAAAMMGLSMSGVLPGFSVDGWQAAIIGAVVLALANTLLKPILFLLTLPFTIVTRPDPACWSSPVAAHPRRCTWALRRQ
jgi:uncharacterized membrane protein YvlD (DUF360 family)